MESVARWAAERGRRVEPFGLDISERLAALARARMPHWADRIFVGDAATWRPPRRFDFVPTELDYVPERHRRDLVRRLLDQTVTAGGRVIVCSYGSVGLSRPADPVEQMLRDWGFDLAGQAGADEGGLPITRVAWVCRR